jgi:signal transduction histidine kinase/ActR/RegA family two-component response regulator
MFHWTPPTGRIYAVPSLDAIYGLATGPAPDTYDGWVRLVHPHDRPHLETYFDSAFSESRPALDAAFRINPPDGPDRWIQMRGAVTYGDDGQPWRVRGVQMDVTRLRRASEMARDAVRLGALHAIGAVLVETTDLRAAAPGVARALRTSLDLDLAEFWLLDPAAGVLECVARANGSAAPFTADALGGARVGRGEGLAGAVWNTLVPYVQAGGRAHPVIPAPPPHDAHDGTLRLGIPIASDGEFVGAVTASGRSTNGSLASWYRFAVSLSGELGAFAHRARNHARLRSSYAKAERSSAAKSEVLAQVSHELRTPLMAITGYTDLLSAGSGGDAQTQAHIAALKVNTEHLLRLVNDLADTSRIEAGAVAIVQERTAPDTLVAEACALVAPRAGQKGLPLRIEFEGTLPATIETDPTRLRQILVNLLDNAVKFTDSGEIRVVVRFLADRPVPRLRFDVIDTGDGIGAADQARVFERSFQAGPRAAQGTGLGLAISRDLARRLGGDIAVRSHLGGGSRFRLTVATGPLTGVSMVQPKRRHPRTPRTAPTAGAAVDRQTMVLVVEDDPDAGAMLAALLEQRGYAVRVARDGASGIAAARAEPPDAALLDLTLPDMSGLALVSRLAAMEELRDATFVALSGRTEPEARERAMRAGFHGFLAKPVDTDVLVAALPPVGAPRARSAGSA